MDSLGIHGLHCCRSIGHFLHSTVNGIIGLSKDCCASGASGDVLPVCYIYNSRRETDGWCYCHALAHGSHPHLGCHICTFPLAAGSRSSGCCGLSHGTPEASEVCRANCHTPLCPQANAYKRRLERPFLATTCCSGLQWRNRGVMLLQSWTRR